jgi:uncharacterized membrane protein
MAQPWQDHLEWAASFGWLGWLALGLLGIAVIALTAANVRSLSRPRRRWVLMTIRATTVILVLAALGQPTWVSQTPRPAGQRLGVVLDRSASMATGPAGQRRWDRALEAVAALAATTPVQLVTAGSRPQPVLKPTELTRLPPSETSTDLHAALRYLADEQRASSLQAVVVISDGLDNGALAARNPSGSANIDADTAELLHGLGVPVHAVFIDDPEPIKDVAITAIRTSSFGFARTLMPVSVDLEISGLADKPGNLMLKLSDNGKLMVTQPVPLAGPSRRSVELEFQPLHVGTHIIEAQVVPLPDEVTEANNRAFAALRVVRERTRILHLAGQPSWDSRFLRTHLRANPSIDLVSFYIMVSQGSGGLALGDDTTLIPFPAKEIFEDALTGFDLIVLQDFPFGPFQLEQYLPRLSQFLKGGGALLVLGGPQSLSAGGYFGSGMAELLPLQLGPPGDEGGWADGSAQLRLTPLGRKHPVTLLGADPDASAATWQRHAWRGRNTGLAAREAGAVLVVDAADHPLLAVGDIGEGRSAVVATDSLWTWAFGADHEPSEPSDSARRDADRRDYHRLFDQLLAWLLRDPSLDLLQLQGPGAPVPQGQALRVQVTARDGAGAVLPRLALRWSAARHGAGEAEEAVWREWPHATDSEGRAELQLNDLAEGAWLITVQAEVLGRPHSAVLPIVIAPESREASQIQPTDRLLQLLARTTSAQVWPNRAPSKGVPLRPLDADDPAAVADRQHTDLWSRPEVLLALLALLSAEWWLRRRWGLA